MPESEHVSSSGSTFALYGICSLPESESVSSSGSTFALYVLSIPHGSTIFDRILWLVLAHSCDCQIFSMRHMCGFPLMLKIIGSSNLFY